MYHLVYKIINKRNGHYYIGVHSTANIDDGYMGSGTLMRFAIKKHGAENFEREVIECFENRAQALYKESQLVTNIQVNDPNCYNLVLGGGTVGKPVYSKKAEKISFLQKNVIPFDKNYEYRVDVLTPVKISTPDVLTNFGKAFWDIITNGAIFEIITRLYNSAVDNSFAKKYIQILERIKAFKYNIVIYRYSKTTLVKNS